MSRKKRISQKVNHLITAGAIEFAPVIANSKCNSVQVNYRNLDTEDVNISIQQTNDDRQFNVIKNASKSLESALPSHTITLVDITAEQFKIVMDPGTASTGIIDEIIWVFE